MEKIRTMTVNRTLPRRHFVFLTLPQYSFIALSSAVEALRMANRVAGQEAYRWSVASIDGQGVAASNGLTLTPTVAINPGAEIDSEVSSSMV